MPLTLRDHLYWCDCFGRVVFLDLAADRYFCLPDKANTAFLALTLGSASDEDIANLRLLTDKGMLIEGSRAEPFRRPAGIESPARDVLDGLAPRTGPVVLFRAAMREAAAARQLRTRHFSDVIALARQRKIGREASSPERTIIAIAAATDRVAFLTRSHNRCLVRALAVHSACRAHGIPARLVLGVIAHPFAAHCWVQFENSVVVGNYEQARLYTPILVIE